MTTTLTTTDHLRRSYAWDLMEEARRRHNATLRDLNYARHQYRTHGGPELAQDLRAADARYQRALRVTNHLDGMVASMCARHGLNPDRVMPPVTDDCPTCGTEVHDTGCACTD